MSPLGQHDIPTTHQANLTGVLKGNPVFWNIQRVSARLAKRANAATIAP
jgi:hypothetical protein